LRRILMSAVTACLAAAALAGPATAGDTAIVDVPKFFDKKLEKIRATSGIDIYLPQKVRAYTKASRVRGTLGASDGLYELQLGVGRCNGANVCTIASFFGLRGEKPVYPKRVKLTGGRTGYFKSLTCGASCSPPAIQWLEGDVLYEISFKGSSQKKEVSTLVKYANSAIKAGPR
jgi:hypothetical protein